MASYNQISTDQLEKRVSEAVVRLGNCEICPRRCGVNRLRDNEGYCRTGRNSRVYSYNPHFGEEAPLVGIRGSGTIFFTGCNMACAFCQNYDISQLDKGRKVSSDILAEMMIRLQDMGCHNINFVTPTHVIPQILEALVHARETDLNIPLIYNSGGYDSIETLKLLDDIFDIYMPDMKYGSNETSSKYSDAKEYVNYAKAAINEMHRQVGDLVIDEEGVAVRGLLVRHLVLPNDLAGTAEVVRFLSEEISRNTYLNIMAQYHPDFNASTYPELDRCVTLKEYTDAVLLAAHAGLTRGLAIF